MVSLAVEGGVRALRLQTAFRLLAKIYPRRVRDAAVKKLLQAGVGEDAEDWAGSITFLALEDALIAFMFAWVVLRVESVEILSVSAFAAFLATLSAAYVLLFVQIEDRKNRLEAALPSLMRMVGSNLRAGMSPMVALRTAARPEFGPVSDEINYATAKALGTESFPLALTEMSKRFDSEIFQRIVSLFSSSLRAGGNLAQLLENASDDLRETRQLKAELDTSSRMYLLFIVFVVVVGTPLLFSVSIQFTGMISKLLEQQAAQGFGGEGGGVGDLVTLPFTIGFITNAALATLAMTSVLASGLIGVIREGKWLSGAKYAPFILAASIASFYVMRGLGIGLLSGT
jgi:flagellar protein FlaJ